MSSFDGNFAFPSSILGLTKVAEPSCDIVELNAQIEEIVARENVLREEISKIIAEIEVQ